MGKPRGKSKKLNDESDQDGSGGEEVSESPSPTPTPPKTKRRRGRPAHKPLKDDVEAEDDKDTGEVEEDDADGANDAKPVVQGSTGEGGAAKKKRRRRRVKRSSSDDYDAVGEDDGIGEGHVRRGARSSGRGFRPNGSRRKSTPRRAAEAGVECK